MVNIYTTVILILLLLLNKILVIFYILHNYMTSYLFHNVIYYERANFPVSDRILNKNLKI